MKRYRVQQPMATLAGKTAPIAQFDTPAETYAFVIAREKNGHKNTQIVDIQAKEVFSAAEFAAKHRLRK